MWPLFNTFPTWLCSFYVSSEKLASWAMTITNTAKPIERVFFIGTWVLDFDAVDILGALAGS
jgi:hypothetical protein